MDKPMKVTQLILAHQDLFGGKDMLKKYVPDLVTVLKFNYQSKWCFHKILGAYKKASIPVVDQNSID